MRSFSSPRPASVWRNRVGLCWRATRQGIPRPGRVNDPLAPAVSAARAFSFPPPPHSFALSCLRKRTSTANQPRFYPQILLTIQFFRPREISLKERASCCVEHGVKWSWLVLVGSPSSRSWPLGSVRPCPTRTLWRPTTLRIIGIGMGRAAGSQCGQPREEHWSAIQAPPG